jgi:cytochrome c553
MKTKARRYSQDLLHAASAIAPFSGPIVVACMLLAVTGCSSPLRTRALGDAGTPALSIAQQVCINCHGAKGNSTSPHFPNLAAQSASYMTEQLKSFRSHGRSDPSGSQYMWGISADLSDEQIDGLSNFYAAQTAAIGESARASLVEQGRKVFSQVNDNGMPACVSCHGAQAEGLGKFPRLAGQHSNYLVKQLRVFQDTNERPEGAIMKSVTHGLSSESMLAVAAYLQALPLLK